MVENDILSKKKILDYLQNKNTDITIFKTVDSTNSYLKRASGEDTPEGTVVIAENQTSGRGRFTRKFYSPDGSGIYMSVLLKPAMKAVDAVLITAAAAVAVSEACENLGGKTTQIKWVNDVLIDSKKVCGILCEGAINAQSRKLDRVILGIGINVYVPNGDFAPEIKDVAGAVFNTVQPDMRNRLIAEVLNCFNGYYKDLEERTFLNGYRKRSAVIGKSVSVLRGDTKTQATALEIDGDCRLLVEYGDKRREYLSSGEVSVRL